LRDTLTGAAFQVNARKLVDATGPWSATGSVRLVRGSHIILPRLNASANAIAHFDRQGRIVFFIPWGSRRQLTLVGTTDVDHTSGPDQVAASRDEIDYLLGIVREVFPEQRNVEAISAYSSLRPLLRDESNSPTSASRGHRIWNSSDGILHIAGGKYTTYRRMSEQAADLICREMAPELAAVHLTAETRISEFDEERAVAYEQHLADHLYITTYLGYEKKWDAAALRPFATAMAGRLGWDERRIEEEISHFLASRAMAFC
jgi:glycerol-3-phosphate dehydrogenase